MGAFSHFVRWEGLRLAPSGRASHLHKVGKITLDIATDWVEGPVAR
jgi:hypothetical protein